MKKTFEDFIENYYKGEYSELFINLWEVAGVDFEEFVEYPNDFASAAAGVVPGLIYYSDTEAFAKSNIEYILRMVMDNEMWNDRSVFTYNDRQMYNNPLNGLAWFAWDELFSELLKYLNDGK